MDTVKRKEDATSKETLEDLEDESSFDTDDTDETEGPSPDGMFDEDDELKEADPL
ncbi:MAG TPA: hypothetical protein VK893_08425 [Pyrinomonadaceae bacterium]|nr:hypothetical protein [Pyrinomonadaceae bacterium]